MQEYAANNKTVNQSMESVGRKVTPNIMIQTPEEPFEGQVENEQIENDVHVEAEKQNSTPMRRPRIKATANITSKRKLKSKTEVYPEKGEQIGAEIKTSSATYIPKNTMPPVESAVPRAENAEAAMNVMSRMDSESFKCPHKILYNCSASNASDISYTGKDNLDVIQMDLHKTLCFSKILPKTSMRQRIRPMPAFQRRNSGIESVSSLVDEPITLTLEATSPVDFVVPIHRRERHYSASITQPSTITHYNHTPNKFTSISGGRMRTESSSSAFSDSFTLLSCKTRKTEENRLLSKRDYEARFASQVMEKSKLKMFDLIYYNPTTNPMKQKLNISSIKSEVLPLEKSEKHDAPAISGGTVESAMPVPQLKLNANGELILDDKSLEIETTAEQEARKALANSSLIFLDENTGMNGFYKRQKRTKDWPSNETVKFYRCLQTIGTDFSLMCQLFPKRTRRDLKLKFKKEERCNGTLINKALLHPKTFNVDELKEQLESEEREREEAECKWKDIKAKKAKNIKKTRVTTSPAARILKNGDDIYSNEMIYKCKMSKRAIAGAEPDCKPRTNEINIIQDIKIPYVCDPLPPKSKKRKHVVAYRKKIKDEEIICVNHDGVTIKTELTSNMALTASKVTESNKSDSQCINTMENSNGVQGEINNLSDAPANNIYDTVLKPGTEEHCMIFNYGDHVNTAFQPTKDLTLMNLDNGSVTVMQNMSETVMPKVISDKPTENLIENKVVSALSVRDLDEHDIQQILTELSEGSLVLVSTLDPDNANKVLNEIYMLDKRTGELCDLPLAIPEEIVQAIMTVMS